MGDLIKMGDYRYPWKEAFATDGPCSSLRIYVDERTGEAEIVQMNDDGESIRTFLSVSDAAELVKVLVNKRTVSNE